MKFQPDLPDSGNVITRREGGRVWINARALDYSVLVPWQGEVQPWGVAQFDDLAGTHFERILALQPELVIFGSGERLRFAPPALWRALIERRIGFETMDTAAACRTFNVLSSERRAVVAALLLQAPPKAMDAETL